MRLLVCTQPDLPSCIALNELLPNLGGHDTRVLLDCSSAPSGGTDPSAWLRWLHQELPYDFIFPLIDREECAPGRLCTFSQLSRVYGIRFDEITTINDGDGYAAIEDFRPDLILSMRFGLIFKAPALRQPPLGVLNVHPGTLPRYAGVYSPFYAMLEGESQMGCTLHIMDEGIDSGPIVGIEYLPIDTERSMFWHMIRLYPLGVKLFLVALERLANTLPLASEAQDRNERKYRSWPTPQDHIAFHAKGFRMIDTADCDDVFERLCGVGAAAPLAAR